MADIKNITDKAKRLSAQAVEALRLGQIAEAIDKYNLALAHTMKVDPKNEMVIDEFAGIVVYLNSIQV